VGNVTKRFWKKLKFFIILASDPGLQLAPVSAGNAVTSDTYIAHPMRRLIRTLVYACDIHSQVSFILQLSDNNDCGHLLAPYNLFD
jgi:hypothetical protein